MEAITQETRKSYLDYLLSHIEFEHIELDVIDMFNTIDLYTLSINDLCYLAYGYGY